MIIEKAKFRRRLDRPIDPYKDGHTENAKQNTQSVRDDCLRRAALASDAHALQPENAIQQADVWVARVDHGHDILHNLALLSDQERQRYDRFRIEADRSRFLTSHMLLRFALSEAVCHDVQVAEWRFQQNEGDKPRVAAGLPRIHFNLSTKKSLAVVATSTACPVGVDIEPLGNPRHLRILSSALSIHERARLNSLPENLRQFNFIRLWTIKEAYAKMRGIGVAFDLQSIEIPACEDACLINESKAFWLNSAWLELRALDARDRRYSLALAVASAGSREVKTRLHVVDTPGNDPDIRFVPGRLSDHAEFHCFPGGEDA